MSDQPQYPPMEAGEYYHIEYLKLIPVEDGGYPSNMVDLARTREDLMTKLKASVADTSVYAIHLRRFEPPVKDVHLYDESQPLAKAQGEAYMLRKAYDQAIAAQDNLGSRLHDLNEHMEWLEECREIGREAQEWVINQLHIKLEEIRIQASRDNDDAVMMEPGDVGRMARVNLDLLRKEGGRIAKDAYQKREGHDHSDDSPVEQALKSLQAQVQELEQTVEAMRKPAPTCPSCGDDYDHSEATCQGVHPGWEAANELEHTLERVRQEALTSVENGRMPSLWDLLEIIGYTTEDQRKQFEQAQAHMNDVCGQDCPLCAREKDSREPLPKRPLPDLMVVMPTATPQQPVDEEQPLCLKCGKPDSEHMLWAQRHLPVFPEAKSVEDGLKEEEW